LLVIDLGVVPKIGAGREFRKTEHTVLVDGGVSEYGRISPALSDENYFPIVRGVAAGCPVDDLAGDKAVILSIRRACSEEDNRCGQHEGESTT